MNTARAIGMGLGLVLLVGLGRPALAQSAEDDVKARKLYRSGQDDYAAGRYEVAAQKFEQAYDLSGRAGLLFNVANCYERIAMYADAAEYLQRYLDSTDAEDVVSIRQRIRRLQAAAAVAAAEAEAEAETQAAAKSEEGSLPARNAPATPPLTNVDIELPAKSRTPYYWMAGGAVALLGGGSFGFLARRAGSDAEAFCTEGGICTADAQSSLDRERNFALAADVSFGVGAAAVGVGLYLLLTREDVTDDDNAISFHPAVFSDGVGVGIAGWL